MIDRKTLRATYLQRFGPERNRDAEFTRALGIRDRTSSSGVLTFQPPDQPYGPIVYASFGASRSGSGNELFLTAAGPFSAFQSVVEDLAASAPRGIEPLQILRAFMRFTPFDAVIVLPEEDGTFPLGKLDGTLRRAFRIVPLTRAERLLGEREPARLLDLLRAAGALVSDPFRACVVEPTHDGGRRANLAELLRRERRWVKRSIASVDRAVAGNAPDCLIAGAKHLVASHQAELGSLESRVPAVFPEPDAPELRAEETLSALYGQLFDDLLVSSVDLYAGLVPLNVRRLFRTFTFLVVGRHPWAMPLRYEVVIGEGREPANDGLPDDEVRLDVFVDTLVSCMPHMFPTSNLEETRARGRAVAERAMGTLDPASGDLWEIQLWSITATAVCLEAAPMDREDVPAAERALREAGDLCARLFVEVGRDAAPARLRLARIAATISRTLYRGFVRASPPVTSTGAPLN
jgi:hypothetical protein